MKPSASSYKCDIIPAFVTKAEVFFFELVGSV